MPRLTLTCELSQVQNAPRQGLPKASAEQTAVKQHLHLRAVEFISLVQSARQQKEPLTSADDTIKFFNDFCGKIKGEVSCRDLVAAAIGWSNVQVLYALRRNEQGESVRNWLSKKFKTLYVAMKAT